MDAKHNGGPAFPHLRRYVAPDTYEPIAEGGMTLRDWFAGQALAGIMTNPDDLNGAMDAALIAYGVADAMLEARK